MLAAQAVHLGDEGRASHQCFQGRELSAKHFLKHPHYSNVQPGLRT